MLRMLCELAYVYGVIQGHWGGFLGTRINAIVLLIKINSLWPGDAIWQHNYGSSFAAWQHQAMGLLQDA